MTADAATRLTADELERLLRAANPGVVLAPARLLRRIIKLDRGLTGIGLQVPHHRTYAIDRDRLLHLVSREELGLATDHKLPGTVLLIARPDAETLAGMSEPDALTRHWRLLFHARVHAALDRHVAEGGLTEADVRGRIQRIGSAEFAEARLVLEQERLLLPPADDRTVYVEFAAYYLELRAFAPRLVPAYFPSLEDHEALDRVFAEDVDGARLLAETRPEGAAPRTEGAEPDESPRPGRAVTSMRPDSNACQRLLRRAARAGEVGNVARAAIFHERAARVAPPEQAAQARSAAGAELDRLTNRLHAVLSLDAAEARAWRDALGPLLAPAAEGLWPAESRLLYDLQKVCLDHERTAYAVDLVEWVYSLGRRPVKRPLPGQDQVLSVKHLRSAAGRVPYCRLPLEERSRLARLLHAALGRAERKLRETFRPVIGGVLAEVGMVPGNLPEQTALHKMREELLDRVVERGYLNMGDLRDSVSRNNLKLPDLAGPKELVLGDRLIRANRRMPAALDGVYHRGEFYLRWLQRLSSLAFGTVLGRFLVLYVLLPFGGAFLTLEGLQHVIDPVASIFVSESSPPNLEGESGEPTAPPEAADEDEEEPLDANSGGVFEKRKGETFHLATPAAVFLLGYFLFGMFYVADFRGRVLGAVALLGRGLRWLVIDLPSLPAVRWLLGSRAVAFFVRFLLRPLLAAFLVWLIVRMLTASARPALLAGAVTFLAGCFVFRSRIAQDVEEAVADWLAHAWQRVSADLVPAVLHAVMAFFKWLVELIDRLLYTVDEWLRFRQGEGRWTFAWKLVLGTAWFVVTYVVRFYVNLFIEPTTNPIKHFPVVTVAAKVLTPFTIILFQAGTALLVGHHVDPRLAYAIVAVHLFLLPGIFGFLAWELKENWRLYRANQPTDVRPVMIGHHGETLRGLLRPGFHSGTLPKLYRKLRRVERHADRAKDRAASRKLRDALHEVEERVRRFVERELLLLLNACRCWTAGPVEAGQVRLGCTRIRIELRCPAVLHEGLWLDFEEESGWLLAGIPRPGWLNGLHDEPRRVLAVGLTGLYKLAAVELIREQIAASFAPVRVCYAVWRTELVAWPCHDSRRANVFPLRDGPRPGPVRTADFAPALPLLFADTRVSWARWVETWDKAQAGEGLPEEFLEDLEVLPVDGVAAPLVETRRVRES